MSGMKMPAGYQPGRWQQHTPYSDPGCYAALVEPIPADTVALSAVARNLIVHYRASGSELPVRTRDDIDARWVEAILDRDQSRHPGDLTAERQEPTRVQGCCRDHSLFSAAVLRQHRVAARIRYGFAGYFIDGFHVDHVVVEVWEPEQRRWRRFDPEVGEPTADLPSPQDIPTGLGSPYETAAEVWRAHRSGHLDAAAYGVAPGAEVGGAWYIHNAVLIDAAFRSGHELLLWDIWAPMSTPDGPTPDQAALVDEVAALVVAADDGDTAAEAELIERMRHDPQLAPGTMIQTVDPRSGSVRPTDLTIRQHPARYVPQ
jgi:hypothetical protein